MSDVKVTVRYDASSINKAISDLKGYELRKIKRVNTVINLGLRSIARKARSKAPVGMTGKLKKSIKVRMFNGQSKGYVAARAPHSHLVEFGTKAVVIKPKKKKVLRIVDGNLGLLRFVSGEVHIPKRKANPYFFNSANEELPAIERKIMEAMEGV